MVCSLCLFYSSVHPVHNYEYIYELIWLCLVICKYETKTRYIFPGFSVILIFFRACAQCDSLPRVVKEPKPRRAWQSNIFYCKSMPSDRFPEHTKQIASRQKSVSVLYLCEFHAFPYPFSLWTQSGFSDCISQIGSFHFVTKSSFNI